MNVKTAMKTIVLTLAFAILLSAAATFAQEVTLHDYFTSVDVRESRIDYEVQISQTGSPIRFNVPPDVGNYEVLLDSEPVTCSQSSKDDIVQVTCPTDGSFHVLQASFHSRYPLFVFPEQLEFKDTINLNQKADQLRYKLFLPSGVITDISALEIAPNAISIEGSRIVLEWKQENANSFEIAAVMKRAAISYTVAIFLSILGTIILAAASWYTWNHRKDLADNIRNLQHRLDVDGLTKVYNRAAFDRDIAARVKDKRTFALAMVDIDHFKRINDTQGHQEGDRILKKVARSLRKRTRRNDTVYRYGGEEFAVILEGVSSATVTKSVAKILTGVATDAGVTASIGVCIHDGSDAKQLIARADKCLYDSKNAGRNRFTVHGQ